MQTYKTPTSALLDSNGRLNSFGFEAERKYSDDMDDEGVEIDLHMFRMFKMKLLEFEVSYINRQIQH